MTQARRFLPLIHEPHACREQLACLVHVTKVRRAHAHETVEFVLNFVEVGQGRTDNNTTHRVANEGYARQLVARTVLTDVLEAFLTEAEAHLCDVAISLAFIRSRLQEEGLWKGYSDGVFEDTHVIGATLEAVSHDKKMHAVVGGL